MAIAPTKVTTAEFKKLIRGIPFDTVYKDKDSIFNSLPPIEAQLNDGIITISGDFELADALIFEKGENYNTPIILGGGNFKNIIFRGGYFKKLVFRRGSYNGYVSIRGGKIDNLILIGGNFDWLGTLDGHSNYEDDKILANEPLEINRFELEGGNYTNNIWLQGGLINRLEIKCFTPIKLHCRPSDHEIYDTVTRSYQRKFISKPNIEELLISRYSNKENFYHFSGLTFHRIAFDNYTNLGNITIAQVEVDEWIRFDNSDIGRINLIDCNLSKATMYFDSSKITEMALPGTQLPSASKITSRIESFGDLTKSASVKASIIYQKRLALSQIKKAYQNMGDTVAGTHYQAMELETYRGSLKANSEWINLSLNYYSNLHGQSWWRPLWLLLVCAICFYILYCRALGFTLDKPTKEGIDLMWHNAGYILEFVNPIRKSDFLPKVLLKGSLDEYHLPVRAVVVDGIAKIFNAYLLYQFIAAFRRHGKKGD